MAESLDGSSVASISPDATTVEASSDASEATSSTASPGEGTTSTSEDDGPDAAEGSEAPASESGSSTLATMGAQGIEITAIEVNQGVAVSVYADGAAIPESNRSTELVRGRPSLVRAHWALDAGWSAREIRADLELHRGGTTETLSDVRSIEGPVEPRTLEGTFIWMLPAEVVTPDLEVSVSLWEADPAATGAPGAAPRAPAQGTLPLSIAPDTMHLNLVMVPLVTPEGEPAVTDSLKEATQNAFFAAYPVEAVNIEWREPIVVDGRLTRDNEAFELLYQARIADGASPDTYYHMLLDPETCCVRTQQNFAWAGIGAVPYQPSAWGADDAHLAMSMVADYYGDSGVSTMLHEVGHNVGRPHAPCGNVAGADPQFPREGDYAEAGIGVQGFDIVRQRLFNPFPAQGQGGEQPYKDMMSYCWPVWWSDYNWQNNLAWLREVNSWANMRQVADEPYSALRVYVSDRGDASWSRTVTRMPPAEPSGDTWARIFARDGRDLTVGVVATEIADGAAHVVTIPFDPSTMPSRVELTFAGRVHTYAEFTP